MKKSKKINKQKGTSAIGLLLSLGTISLIIAGVSLKTDDVISAAYDVQGLANVRQIAVALELYYLEHESYPQTNEVFALDRWQDLIGVLKQEHFLASFPSREEFYDYRDFNSGQNYILRFLPENCDASYLENDWDGIINGFDCQDPYYCLYM